MNDEPWWPLNWKYDAAREFNHANVYGHPNARVVEHIMGQFWIYGDGGQVIFHGDLLDLRCELIRLSLLPSLPATVLVLGLDVKI